MSKLPIISFFSGPGGLDLGFTNEGFDVIAAFDKSKAAVKTYNMNNIESCAENLDLSKATPSQIIDIIEKKKKSLKPVGLIGGPPCQYFSVSNVNKKQDDPRRTLPLWYASTLKALNEKYKLKFFLFENVAGMAAPKHKEDLDIIKEKLEFAGFWIKPVILNAKDYAVPQDRKRLFILGLSKNFTHTSLDFFPPPIIGSKLTVKDAIYHLPEPVYTSATAKEIEKSYHQNHVSMVPKSSRFITKDFNTTGGRSFRKLDWNRPSWTVAYGNREMHIHPNCNRRVSVYEAMLLQGFPPDYRLFGNFSEQVSQVSDAVPPPLAAVLAKNINDILNHSLNIV